MYIRNFGSYLFLCSMSFLVHIFLSGDIHIQTTAFYTNNIDGKSGNETFN